MVVEAVEQPKCLLLALDWKMMHQHLPKVVIQRQIMYNYYYSETYYKPLLSFSEFRKPIFNVQICTELSEL